MAVALKFWTRLLLWTAVLLAMLVAVSLITGMSASIVFATLPVWAGLALMLAAFPAGLAVSLDVLPDDGVAWRGILYAMAAVVLVSAVAFVLAGWVGPGAARWLARNPEMATAVQEPAGLSLPELKREMMSAIADARAATGEPTIGTWLPANRLAWHYYSRQDGSLVLPVLFGWLGIFMAFWTRRSPRADLRQLQHWAMGLFLVATTYLMGENSYELIVLNAAGLVDFAADFRLLIPGAMAVGFGWPTVIALWQQHSASAVD